MARAASAEEFDRFFQQVKHGLVGQAYLLTSDAEESQDLAQEALLRAWREWSRVSQLESPEAWVRRVLHNLIIGSWRRRRTSRRHPFAERTSLAPDRLDAEAVAVAEALRRLPKRHRQVLVLKAVVGMSTAEIAAELGAGEGTVRVWLSRARAELSSALALERATTTEEQKR